MKTYLNRIVATIISIIGAFFYGNYQGRKSEKSKADAMLLDDVVAAKKIDNDINSLSDDEVDSRLQQFSRKRNK